MTFTASTLEEAALEGFLLRQGYGGQVGELGYPIGRVPETSPGETAERKNVTIVEFKPSN